MDFYTPEQDQKRAAGEVAIDPSLPSVRIIGDSISIGYTPFVRELLVGKWNVTRPRTNCGDTIRGLASIDEWLADQHWDVIHFNWGLHDLCWRGEASTAYGNRDKVNGKLSVPIDLYARNLESLVVRMRGSAGRLIWADTTLVPEGEPGRFVGEELKYNAVASRIMARYGVETNDLRALTGTFGAELFVAPGDVHYTEQGYRLIAQQVADAIRAGATVPGLNR